MFTTVNFDNRANPDTRKIVAFALTRPVLLSGTGAQPINQFLERFVLAYQNYIESDFLNELSERYLAADRAVRLACFPVTVRLHCLCRETDSLFSAHFTAEVTSGEDSFARCASFVWNSDSGDLLRLADLTDKAFAAAHRGWVFYLASDGLRLYRADKKGRIVKREKIPNIKSEISS